MEDKVSSLEFSGEKGTVTQRAGVRHCNTARQVCTTVTQRAGRRHCDTARRRALRAEC